MLPACFECCQATQGRAKINAVLSDRSSRLLELALVTGPFFGYACTILARQIRRRQGVWFFVGYGLNFVGFLIIAVLWLRERPRRFEEPE